MRRSAVVLLAALGAAGMPVLAAWAAARAAASAPEPSLLPLLLALAAAPVVAILGALAALLWLAAGNRVAARPGVATASAVATLAGMLGGVYVHVLGRAWVAGGAGVPPLGLVFQVEDFARAVPFVPAGLMLGTVIGAWLAERAPFLAVAAAFGAGALLAAGAGLATAVPVALASLVGSAVTFGVSGAIVALLAGLAGRRSARA